MVSGIAISGISIIKGSPTIEPGLFTTELNAIDTGPYELNQVQKISAIAFVKALEDANIDLNKVDRRRVSIFLGNAYSTEQPKIDFKRIYSNTAPGLVNPSVFTFTTANSIAGWLAIQFGIQGPNLTFTNGCISSSQAIIAGCDSLTSGKTDVAIVGGISLLSEDLKKKLYECGFKQEIVAFLVLEKSNSLFSARRKPYILISGFQQGFLSNFDIESLNNRQMPAELQDFCSRPEPERSKHILVHLGHSLAGEITTFYEKEKKEYDKWEIDFLNDSIGNAFSAAGISGITYAQKEIFVDIDSYGAYAGFLTNAQN